MNRRPNPRRPIAHPRAYRQAFEWLDEALARNADSSNARKIELLGECMFGDEWNDPAQAAPGEALE